MIGKAVTDSRGKTKNVKSGEGIFKVFPWQTFALFMGILGILASCLSPLVTPEESTLGASRATTGITVFTSGYTHIYWWSSVPTNTPANATWPGVAMSTDPGTGLKTYTFPSATSINLIFSNNGSGQSANLSRTTGAWLYSGGIWTAYNPSPTVSATPGTSSFSTSTLAVTLNAANPPTGTYKIDSGTAVSYTNGQVISLPGADLAVGQTRKLTLVNGTATTTYTYTKSAAPAAGITVYTSAYTHIYWWSSVPANAPANGTWPGVAMSTDPGTGLKTYTFPSATSINLIFTNNGSGQSADLSRTTGAWLYSGGTWTAYNPSPSVSATPGTSSFSTTTLSVTLSAANPPTGTYKIDNGTAVSYTNGQVISLPGADLAVGQTRNLTLVNGTATTTYTYTKSAAPAAGITVYTSAYTHIYWWSSVPVNTPANATWPGVAMTTDSASGLKTYTFPSATSINLIFTNNGSGQSADLSRTTGAWLYSGGAWTAYAPVTSATASPAGGTFTTSTSITLNASNPGTGTYKWDSGSAVSYTSGTVITPGADWTVGQSKVLTVANGTVSNSYTFSKTSMPVTVDANNLRIYQVMVESYQDGDPNANYGVGYGPSNHRGDLKGITAALDYIKSLGVNALWLTPIFNSNGSSQLDATGYFTQNYFQVDPKFGTFQDAQDLVNKAHSLGIYVFLDGVFGHHKSGVIASPTGKLPTGGDNPVAYPGSLDFYKEVAVYWINALGIDGWRLDQAYQVPVNYWTEIRAAVETASAARKAAGQVWGTLGYMVGEIWKGETDIASQGYGTASNPGLKSNFDFPLRYSLVQVLATQETTTQPGAYGQSASRLNAGYQSHSAYPSFAMPNLMLTNHDLVRFGDLIQRAPNLGYGPENADYWKRHKAALSFVAAFTGPITLYYGDEYGAQVDNFVNQGDGGYYDDHVSRDNGKVGGFNANETDLINYTKSIMAVRDGNPALWKGTRTNLLATGSQYADLKVSGTNKVVYTMNTGTTAGSFILSQSAVGGTKVTDLQTGTVISASGGNYTVSVPALSARFLKVE